MAIARGALAQVMKKILMIIFGIAIVGGLVFGGLMLFGEKLDWSGASNYVSGMLDTQKVVTDFMETEVENWSEAEKSQIALFSEKSELIGNYYRSLGASSVLKNEEVKAKYDGISEKVRKIEEVAKLSTWLNDFLGKIEQEGYKSAIFQMKESAPNEWASGMVADLSEYAGKIEQFEEKYSDRKTEDYSKMTEEYGILMIEGRQIEEKYEKMNLTEIAGIESAEVVNLFDNLRDLQKNLEEKK